MPSVLHEALIEMFRARPMLAAELLEAARVIPPDAVAHGVLMDAQLTQVVPTEYRADVLLRFEGASRIGAVVEAQLRPDPVKWWSWAVYVATARAKLRCPIVLLVIALDPVTEEWASKPIELGPGSVVQPVVLGVKGIPVITDPVAAAASPELAVLSAIAHGKEPIAVDVGRAALSAVLTLDEARCQLYSDLVILNVHHAARIILESLMLQNWEPQSEFFKNIFARAREQGLQAAREELMAEGRELGLAQGRELGLEEGHLAGLRDLLTRQLTRRFGALPDGARARIGSATEAELTRWGEDLLFADSLQTLLGDRRD